MKGTDMEHARNDGPGGCVPWEEYKDVEAQRNRLSIGIQNALHRWEESHDPGGEMLAGALSDLLDSED